MIVSTLSSQLILATLTSAGLFFDPTAVKHSCVDPVDNTTLTPNVPVHLEDIDTTYDAQTILLKPLTCDTIIAGGLGDGEYPMCVLHHWTRSLEDRAAKKGFYHALGRSEPTVPAERYENHTGTIGGWARPAGRASRQVEYVCGEAGNAGAKLCSFPVASIKAVKSRSGSTHRTLIFLSDAEREEMMMASLRGSRGGGGRGYGCRNRT